MPVNTENVARHEQKNMEAELEAVLKSTELTLVRLKPQPAATHLVVKKVGAHEIALPIKAYPDTGRLWQRLTSPEQAGPSVFWMKNNNVVVVPPGVIKTCAMKPDRVEAMFPAATHSQEDIGSVLLKTLLSQQAGLQDVATTRQRLEPDSTKNRQDSLQYHRNMESALEGLLEEDGMRLVRLKPHSSATHLVVRTTGREVALPVRFRVETEHLFQGLLSDEHRGPSIFWMKDQTIVFLGPGDIDSNSLRPQRVKSVYKSSTHMQSSVGSLLERVIIAQESELQDLQITRLRHEPDLYDRALAIREAGFLVDLSNRSAVLKAVNEQLANLFPSPQSNILKALTQQDLASHTYTPGASRPLMPVKVVVEQKQGCVALLEGKYDGLLVLWLLTGHCLLIERSAMAVNAWTAPQVYRLHADKLVPYGGLPCALKNWYDKSWIPSGKRYMPLKKHETLTRDEAVNKSKPLRTYESEAQEELCSILGSRYVLTPEACTADAGFLNDDGGLALPIQLKTASLSAKKTYKFVNTTGYDDMILICRLRGKSTNVILPGYGAPQSVFLSTRSPSWRFTPLLVRDDQLLEFLLSLYSAVKRKDLMHTWPSGECADISQIKLLSVDTLNMPKNANRTVERGHFLWRQAMFPDLEYVMPSVQNTSVDVLIDAVRVQDKTARPYGQGYKTSLQKNGGRVDGRPTATAYALGDFDALCVFVPDHKYIFLIPATVLAAKGYLKTDVCSGKKNIYCYVPGYRPTGSCIADTWTAEYAIATSRSDAQILFQESLQKSVANEPQSPALQLSDRP